jgi:hypothetical protein
MYHCCELAGVELPEQLMSFGFSVLTAIAISFHADLADRTGGD